MTSNQQMRIKKMRASQKLIDHIKRSEGVSLTAYQDSAGIWTIGYGHTAGVKKGRQDHSVSGRAVPERGFEEVRGNR